MPTASEELRALRAGRGGGGRGFLSKAKGLYEELDKPLWEQPQEWGKQFGDYIMSGDTPDESVFQRMLRRTGSKVSNLAGGVVSGLTSPISLGTTAATLGAGIPARIGVNAARGLGIGARASGMAQIAHGGIKGVEGLQEGDLGAAGAGAVEAGLGAFGVRTPISPRIPTKEALRRQAFTLRSGEAPPTSTLTSVMPQPAPPISPTRPLSAARTSTYPTPSQGQWDAMMMGQTSPRAPGYTGMRLPAGTGGPTYTAPHIGLPSGPPGLGNVTPLGVVERGAVRGGPPIGPVSAGMNVPGPGQRSFEALVPDRYKSPPSTVTPEGLAMNLRGEPPVAPTPGLPSLGKQGQVIRTPAAKGAVSLEQMVEKYGIDEAAKRARMTAGELRTTLLAKKVGPSKKPSPPQPKSQAPVPPKIAEVPAPVKEAAKAINNLNKYGQMDIAILKSLAKMGDTVAAEEVARRVAGSQKPPKVRVRPNRLKNEAGVIGPGASDVIEKQRLAGELPTRPSSGADWPPKSPEGKMDWDAYLKEKDVRDRKMFFEAAKKREADAYQRQVDDVMRRNPNYTPAEADDVVFKDYSARIDRTLAAQKKAKVESAMSESDRELKRTITQGRKAKWERPPFKEPKDIAPVKLEAPDDITVEPVKYRPNKNWHAGQHDIDRMQVEAVKKFGINDPERAGRMKPYLVRDQEGKYHIFDGHHRMTAALEKDEAIDMLLEDLTPSSDWGRQVRGDATGLESGWKKSIREMAEKWREKLKSSEGPFGRLKGEEGSVKVDLAAPEWMKKPLLKGKAAKGFDAVDQARKLMMLTGLAPAKSVLGNIGSHGIAALENPSMAKAIGREFVNLPEHARMIKKGWKQGVDPEVYGPMGKWNVIGRGMGSLDFAAQKSLQRAGLSEEAAKEILLTNPNAWSSHPALKTEIGRMMVPFKTIPSNAFLQGVSRYTKHPGIYAGAGVAGFAGGSMTDDPEKIALMSAAMGPYAVPFLAGAAIKGGARTLHGISPLPEWSIQKTIQEPWAPFTEPPGARWFKGEETRQDKERAKREKKREGKFKSQDERRKEAEKRRRG